MAPKKKKPLSQIIQEKEERRRRELEEKRAREEGQRATLTPEEERAERLRQQRMQEEADLQLAKEAFGLAESDGIDSAQPVTKEDFDNLRKALAAKLTACERSAHYMGFLDDLLRDLSLNMEPEDVKRLSSSLNAVANEKVKQQKVFTWSLYTFHGTTRSTCNKGRDVQTFFPCVMSKKAFRITLKYVM